MGYEQVALVLRRRRAVVLMAFDLSVLVTAYALFTVLRYSGLAETPAPWTSVAIICGAAVVVQLAAGWALLTYRGRAGVGSTDETVQLVLVGLLAAAVAHLVNVLGPTDLVGRTVSWGAGLASVAVWIFARAQWRRHAASASSAPRSGRTMGIGPGMVSGAAPACPPRASPPRRRVPAPSGCGRPRG
jgi:hypothetical protein